MKKSIKIILCMVLVSAFMIVTISAINIVMPTQDNVYAPMSGSCYIDLGRRSVTYTERYYGTVLESSSCSPNSEGVENYSKNGHNHTGTLYASEIDPGNRCIKSKDGVYTIYTYPDASARFCGFISCNGDTSETSIEYGD